MEYRRLGRSGLQVSALSFGTWVTFGNQVEDGTAEGLLKTSWENGINFFDNAEAYAGGKSEEVMGQLIQKLGWPRDEYVVSSKVFWGGSKPNQTGLSRKHVFEACDKALKRLRVDYLDLYFCHRPDPHTPIEETVRAMTDLVRMGKVLYWGTSEWSAREITEAFGVAGQYGLVPPTMEQPQYNLLVRGRFEEEYAPIFKNYGYGTTIWSPLASGLLTGKYNNGIPEGTRATLSGMEWLRGNFEGPEAERKLSVVRALGKVADGLGISLARMSIAWCLLNPNVSTVILGASRVSQLEENLKALEDVRLLTPDVVAAIESALAAGK